jgi:short-subunit dehydrogenase
MELRGRRVLITGASRGIGAAIAAAFAAAGAHVALVARSSDALAAVAERLRGSAHPADLGHADEVAGLVERVESEAGGPIDVLVSSAGVEVTKAIWDHTAAEVEQAVRLNFLTPLELSRQAAVLMRARGAGRIVNISSLSAAVVIPGFAVYGATKAGLSHFTTSLATELRGSGVGVTLVEVGPVYSKMLEQIESYAPTRQSYDRLIRLGLLARLPPEDVARAVVRAVERDRGRVWLPRRSALSPLVAELPRTVTTILLRGIRAR